MEPLQSALKPLRSLILDLNDTFPHCTTSLSLTCTHVYNLNNVEVVE